MKKNISRNPLWPDWYNGKKIDEVQFGRAFLEQWPLKCVNGTLYTLDGPVEDESEIKQRILENIEEYVTSSLSKKVINILETIKLLAFSDPFPIEQDCIHLQNGVYHLPDGSFQESRLFCQNRLPVKYDPKAANPERWFAFLHELLDDADIPTLQEYLGYCLIPSTKGQKMMLIVGKGGKGKSRIGLVLKRLMGDAANNGSVQKVENNRFARADLERRLLMIDNDMDKLRPYHIEALYDTLSKTPCGQYVGGKRRDLSPKQQKRTLSGTTLHEVHQLLHNSFLLAVEWGILIKSPVPVEAPKKTTQERSIWEVEEMRAALDSIEDPILHLAVHLTLVGALREGEVAGLTPEDIDFDAANSMGTFTVNRSMQRVQKDTLAQVDKGCILRIFPDKLEGSKTSLILKDTKTEASCRTIFMTAALREELKQWLERLKREEALDPERYRNSGMLLRLPNGLAVEPVLIRKKFLKWQDAHPEFPRIVFHGLRHSSATYQLMISGGDIKAVQGTTGHASADMLVNTYAHIQQSSRVELGKKFESGFYAKPGTPSPQAVPAAGEPTISMTALLELLKDADPEMKAKLRLALLT